MNSHMNIFAFVLCSVLLVLMVNGFSRNLPIMPFDEGYTHLFGDKNLMVHEDGKSAHITLDGRTGSGFVSQEVFLHGYFSASIKLPADYTAGVVVTFYMSNSDTFEKNHDEIDFEFLGNIRGKDWRIQTNVYGNGSTNVGREERYGLWFDPAEDFHQYSLLWTQNSIVFYIDNVPIREFNRTEAMGGDFPSKPMSMFATIWDGSKWATNGGKYKVNYKYAPYIAHYSDFVLHGCAVDPIDESKCDGAQTFAMGPTTMTGQQRAKMVDFRNKYMQYSYCYDRSRYKIAPSECTIDPKEAEHLQALNPVKFGGGRPRHPGKKHRHQRNRADASSI